jgi:hypothetical protein
LQSHELDYKLMKSFLATRLLDSCDAPYLCNILFCGFPCFSFAVLSFLNNSRYGTVSPLGISSHKPCPSVMGASAP